MIVCWKYETGQEVVQLAKCLIYSIESFFVCFYVCDFGDPITQMGKKTEVLTETKIN